MKKMFVVLMLLSLTPVVYGQADKAGSSHYKAAEQMLTLMDMPTVLKNSVDQMVKMQVQQNPSIAPFEPIMRQFLAKYMSWDTLKADMVKIYMEEFTEAELGELNKFYQTPVGKKTVEKMPILMNKGAEMGSKRVQEHMPELQAAITEEAKKQQGGAAAAPAAPSAAPKASPKK